MVKTPFTQVEADEDIYRACISVLDLYLGIKEKWQIVQKMVVGMKLAQISCS